MNFAPYGPFVVPMNVEMKSDELALQFMQANPLLNDASGVYVFIDAKRGLPVYVGLCSSFGSRIAGHFNKQHNAQLREFLKTEGVEVSLLLVALAANDEANLPSNQRVLRRIARTDHDYKAIQKLERLLIGTCQAVNNELFNLQSTSFTEKLMFPVI